MTNKYFVLIFFMLALNIQAQEIKNKKDELLLYSQFGEFCTMCEEQLFARTSQARLVNHS